MIYIALTADYELFFGKNFLSYDEVLFEPTQKILERLSEYDIPLNLFADICSVWRHRDFDISVYADKFESQLIEAVKHGNDVQLHLHPHWLNSTYDGKDWVHDQKKFKLQDFGFDNDSEISAGKIIRKGKEYLERLLTKHYPEYKCIAFRAGGYCLQPNENELIKALLDEGIKIDSSIIPNLSIKSNVNEVNFGNVPDAPNWFMSFQNGINHESDDGIFEIPIPSSIKLAPKFRALIRKFIDKDPQENIVNKPRGVVIQRKVQSRESFVERNVKKIKYLIQAIGTLECERMIPKRGMDYMFSIYQDWIERYDCYDDIYLSIIMHPKSIFGEHIDNLIEFINKAKELSELRFVTFTDIHKKLFSDQREI